MRGANPVVQTQILTFFPAIWWWVNVDPPILHRLDAALDLG
jgi:hypothetical protein